MIFDLTYKRKIGEQFKIPRQQYLPQGYEFINKQKQKLLFTKKHRSRKEFTRGRTRRLEQVTE